MTTPRQVVNVVNIVTGLKVFGARPFWSLAGSRVGIFRPETFMPWQLCAKTHFSPGG